MSQLQSISDTKLLLHRKVSMTYADITIGNTSIPCLVDTGSNHSLLNYIYYKLMRKRGLAGSIFPCSTMLKCGSQKKIEVIGQAFVFVKFENIIQNRLFIITKNLATTCIIGLAFLIENNVFIDFDKQIMSLLLYNKEISTPIYSLMLEFD